MIRPRMNPARVSVNQWTLRYILEKIIATMISAVVSAIVNFILSGFVFVSMYVRRPRKTMLIVTWPLGREKLASVIIGFGGRATWRISFEALIITPVIRIVDARMMLFVFWDLRKK